jgi:hypothetical protein
MMGETGVPTMANRRTLELTTAQQQTLEEGRDHHSRPFVRERCAALLKIAGGKSAHWVAQHGLLKERDPATIYAWLSRSQEEGLAGILTHRPGGYRRKCP